MSFVETSQYEEPAEYNELPVVVGRISHMPLETRKMLSKENEVRRKRLRRRALIFFAVVVCAFAGTIAFFLSRKKNSVFVKEKSLKFISMRNIMKEATGLEDLNDPNSPQSKALDWIVFEDSVFLTRTKKLLIQRYVVAVFYFGLMGKSGFLVSDWLSVNVECDWDFIECKNGYITSLNLNNMQLEGEIPSEITHLEKLETLNMAHNSIYGQITVLENMVNLKNISLTNNILSGDLTRVFSQSKNLEVLQLNMNVFIGTIPTEFEVFSNLKMLDLSDNEMSGSIPRTVLKVLDLISIKLTANSFTGVILDELTAMGNLTEIDVGQNNFEGSIPNSLESWKSLQSLVLYENKFEGSIPSAIKNLASLTNINLNDNRIIGSIPENVGNLKSLIKFEANKNGITGTIPRSIYSNCTSLELLSFSYNMLIGSIPTQIGLLSSLKFLALDNNFMTGQIPSEIGLQSELSVLMLENNRFSGLVPTALWNLANLTERLYLFGTDLTGTVPRKVCSNVKDLQLKCSRNKFVCSCCDINQCMTSRT